MSGAGLGRHWFEDLAEHAGPAYLRHAFTKGTDQEVTFLWDALALQPGRRVLDVGCGPGRHAHALARRGAAVVGVDVSDRFVRLAAERAPAGATFVRADARRLPFDGTFDNAISLCQGAFGLALDDDGESSILAGIVRSLRPGGVAAVSAFSAYFQLRWLEESDRFDADSGVNHERTVVRDGDGRTREFDLWTSCFTPRELRLLGAAAGARVEAIWSVAPGEYAARAPDLAHPEWLVVLRRPADGTRGATL